MSRPIRLFNDDRQFRGACTQPQLRTGPGYPILARYGFYKLLRLQFIWKRYSKIRVSFSLFNRTPCVRLANMFATKEIVEQLEHVRKLQFRKSELAWLAGNTFYGHRGIFERAFLEWLEQDFKLSDCELSVTDGQFHLSFEGYWPVTTMWELYALSIFDELRTRASMKKLSEFYLDILYARSKTKLWSKIERLRGVPSLEIPKPNGQGVRKLGIPCVLDRFVQQAVLQVTAVFRGWHEPDKLRGLSPVQ